MTESLSEKPFSFWDFYDEESGDIVLPDGLILRFVSPDDTIGSRLRADIRRREDSAGTVR